MEKSFIGMLCVTVLGAIHLFLYGDGSTLMGCITAISALAGVEVGKSISKEE